MSESKPDNWRNYGAAEGPDALFHDQRDKFYSRQGGQKEKDVKNLNRSEIFLDISWAKPHNMEEVPSSYKQKPAS